MRLSKGQWALVKWIGHELESTKIEQSPSYSVPFLRYAASACFSMRGESRTPFFSNRLALATL
jgi:hypothetical protein